MSQITPRTVEFIGGPFDGHVELLSPERRELPEHVLCYVSENAFRQLHGEDATIHGEDATSPLCVTSVAIYTSVLHGAVWVYFFVKSVAPDSVVVEPGGAKPW